MRQTCNLLFVLLLSPFIVPAQVTTQFTHYSQGGANSAAFTTNNFKCIAVGKGNRIWAGTQYGGLYTYSDSFNIWLKSDKLTNVFINDIKADADSGIWVAQSGQQSVGGNSNIAGGVNYFPVASDISMQFYSVAGTTTSADLQSRNAKSLYVDQSYKTKVGKLPRPWVAQGTYITSFNTRRGGLNIGLKPFATYFTNVPGGFSSSPAATPICEAIGGNSEEVWVAVRQNGTAGSQILRYEPGGTFKSFYDTTGTGLPNGFTAQAIHFDASGNRWIGLKAGGLVIKTPTGWVKMNSESLIPPGTQINFNAIASDDMGNVYIGTSSGMLEYLSPVYNISSSPDYVPSYKLYTTSNGLLNNNVTGIAYDKKNGKILITSSGGVTFMNKREPFIKGVVFNVYTSIDSLNNYSGLQKKAIAGGVRVTLLKDGIEEEVVQADGNGIYELKEAQDDATYSVEVRYVKNGRPITYLYNNVRNHTLMEPSLMPDSLIGEIKAFKAKMQNRCFPVTIYFGIETNLNLFCTEGFKTGSYDAAYEAFYNSGGFSAGHQKKVDNLASYYASLATVYKLGGHATSLATDAVSNLFDAVESLRAFAEFGFSLKKGGNADPLEEIGEEIIAGLISAIKFFKDGLVMALTESLPLLKDYPDAKKLFERSITSLNEVCDLVIEAVENGGNQAVLKAVLDNLKKVMATLVAIDYYREEYAQGRHSTFVAETSLSAYAGQSELTYTESFDNLFNPLSNSIAKYSKDTLDNRKATIEKLSKVAKIAELASNGLDAASALALVPGGQIAGAIAKGLSLVAKGTKTAALTGAMYQGAVGASEVNELSGTIKEKVGFKVFPGKPGSALKMAQNAPDSLIARKNRYNLRLSELQAIYTAPVYDAMAYRNKRRQFLIEDSLYSAELTNTLNALWASADTAVAKVPGFAKRLSRVVDSFVSEQYTKRQSLYFQNLAYIFEPNKTLYAPGLDSIANEIRLANDSAVNGIAYLIDDINNNNIGAGAYLVQVGYQLNHTRVPGSAGTVTYSFKNYGAEAQNNVSFKIGRPTGGYTITGSDSVNTGTIQPGQTKQVSFSFLSPVNDSLGHYIIDVKASNGSYKDVYGSFYVIDPAKYYSIKNGNWNDPATWSSNLVPTASNSVHIGHTVTVNVDANCKTVTVNNPGNLIISTGRRITILH